MTATPLLTTYDGRKYRSRVEARWAVFFHAMGLSFQYEPDAYALSTSCYLPDFWLPAWQMFFEVKGDEPSEEETGKCAELATLTGRSVLLAIGAPEEAHQLQWFDHGGQRQGRFLLGQDVVVDAGFWLLSDEVAIAGEEPGLTDFWIGPPDKAHHRRGPMMTGALEQARDYAKSAKFDRGQMPRGVQPFPHAPERQAAWLEAEADRQSA